MWVAAILSAMAWWIFIIIAHRLLVTPSTIQHSHSGRSRSSRRPMTSAAHRNRAVSSPRKCGAPHVMGDVDVGCLNPLRRFKIQRIGMQYLPEPWHRKYMFGHALDEGVVVGHRPRNDGYAADRQTDVAVGVLYFEKARIKRRQMLHHQTVRRRPMRR